MNLAQAFKMAFKSIASKKTRSFLTMLGVIFGLYPAVKASGLQPVEALRAD